MRFIVADRREQIVLAVPTDTAKGGVLTVTGRFPVSKRILELTDAQVALFEEPLVELCKAKVLFAPAGWPSPPAEEEPAEAEPAAG